MKKIIKYFLAMVILLGLCTMDRGTEEAGNTNNINVIIPSVELNKSDTQIKNGSVYFSGKLFSGILVENYPDGKVKSQTEYFQGKKWGKELKWYYAGQLYTERFYKGGMKDSINTGYWANGNKKFEYEFSTGNYDGSFKEWYPNGKISIWMNYKNGKEDGSQKGWRENGKLFINYVVKNGKTYGVVKSRLCYSVKNGKGQFTSININYSNGSSGSSKLQSE
jgi:antitoxin component YwqK of YwqJK toxin-antitoxin module